MSDLVLQPGKLPADLLRRLLAMGEAPPELLLPPTVGEDACAIAIQGGVLIAATDPITLTGREIGGHAVVINANDGYSNTIYLPLMLNGFCTLPTGPANVTLHLQAEDDVSGVADMMISHLSDCKCGTWESYSATKAWYVPAEATTIYVKFRDNAGNVSEVVTDTIQMSVQSFTSLVP